MHRATAAAREVSSRSRVAVPGPHCAPRSHVLRLDITPRDDVGQGRARARLRFSALFCGLLDGFTSWCSVLRGFARRAVFRMVLGRLGSLLLVAALGVLLASGAIMRYFGGLS